MVVETVFQALKVIMQPYVNKLECKIDTPTHLYLETSYLQNKPLFFGAVQIKRNYVSFHLMSIYTDPDLLASTSAELKAAMQGKSCFNFKTVNPALFEQLTALTKASFESYRQNGYIAPN